MADFTITIPDPLVPRLQAMVQAQSTGLTAMQFIRRLLMRKLRDYELTRDVAEFNVDRRAELDAELGPF